jgi:YVTN family beta-propeller protein
MMLALLVGNENSGTVSIIDPSTWKVACELDAKPDFASKKAQIGLIQAAVNWYAGDGYADDIDVSPDGRTLYVSRPSFNDVAAFDLTSGRLAWTVELAGYRSDHIKLDPSGGRLFAAAVTAGKVQVISTPDHRVVGEIPTGSRPHGIDFSADGKRVFIGELKGDALVIADAATLAVVKRIPFAAGVRPFALTQDGRLAYLQLSDFQGFLAVDLERGEVIKTVSLPENDAARAYHGVYPKDAAHHGISLTPDGEHLCIAGTAANYAAIVARSNLAVEALVPVGEQPAWSLASPDGRYCIVSSRGANTVSVISMATKTEERRIPVGKYPLRLVLANIPDVCAARRAVGAP